MIQIKNPWRSRPNQQFFFIRPNFWHLRLPDRPEISVCLKKFVFPPLGHLPPCEKKHFFFLMYEHMYLENIPLKWWYFVIWLKMETNPQLRFPQNGIFIKKHFGHFLLLFFNIFFDPNFNFMLSIPNVTKTHKNGTIVKYLSNGI